MPVPAIPRQTSWVRGSGSFVRPLYPDDLRAAKVGGPVTMDAVIGTDGFVRDIQNVKGPHPELDAAAADAVRRWQFSPTLLNCEPIEVT